MLTRDQILYLLEELSWKTVYQRGQIGHIRLQERVMGWQTGTIGALQAALSIMLQATTSKTEAQK